MPVDPDANLMDDRQRFMKDAMVELISMAIDLSPASSLAPEMVVEALGRVLVERWAAHVGVAPTAENHMGIAVASANAMAEWLADHRGRN